jgi:hypothetical protein
LKEQLKSKPSATDDGDNMRKVLRNQLIEAQAEIATLKQQLAGKKVCRKSKEERGKRNFSIPIRFSTIFICRMLM